MSPYWMKTNVRYTERFLFKRFCATSADFSFNFMAFFGFYDAAVP